MLLHEQATVQTFFEHQNPNLSWFDAREALPLPPQGQTATYVIGSSAPLSAQTAAVMGQYASEDGPRAGARWHPRRDGFPVG